MKLSRSERLTSIKVGLLVYQPYEKEMIAYGPHRRLVPSHVLQQRLHFALEQQTLLSFTLVFLYLVKDENSRIKNERA